MRMVPHAYTHFRGVEMRQYGSRGRRRTRRDDATSTVGVELKFQMLVAEFPDMADPVSHVKVVGHSNEQAE